MFNDMDQVCIVHYEHINITEPLRVVTETSFTSLLENKKIRRPLGGDNLHNEQCERIQETHNVKEYRKHGKDNSLFIQNATRNSFLQKQY